MSSLDPQLSSITNIKFNSEREACFREDDVLYLVFWILCDHREVPELQLDGADFRDGAVWTPLWSMSMTCVQVDIRERNLRFTIKAWKKTITQLFLHNKTCITTGIKDTRKTRALRSTNPVRSVAVACCWSVTYMFCHVSVMCICTCTGIHNHFQFCRKRKGIFALLFRSH